MPLRNADMENERLVISKIEAVLMRLKYELAAIKTVVAVKRYSWGIDAKYDPEQPRVPAGESGGGQWTRNPDSSKIGNPLESFAAASRRGRSWKFCAAQYTIDGLMCSSLESPATRAACWRQAAERLGACLAGRPIPPLIY